MPAEINYKNKYMELRSKYMNDVDMAFRLGFEQGQQQAAQDQMAQQQAEAQAAQEAAMNGGAPGEEAPAESAPGEEMPQDSAHPGGSELDQHIAKLESLLGKSEDAEIKKSLQNLISIRKSELQAIELKKSAQAISGIAKALHKPKYKMGVQASHNLNDSAKKAVSMQHKIVSDVMAKMEEEEKKASKEIKEILQVEGLTKKE